MLGKNPTYRDLICLLPASCWFFLFALPPLKWTYVPPETSVDFHRTTRCNTPKDITVHSHRRKWCMWSVTIFAFHETSLEHGNHNLHATKDNIKAQIRDEWEHTGIRRCVRHTRRRDAENKAEIRVIKTKAIIVCKSFSSRVFSYLQGAWLVHSNFVLLRAEKKSRLKLVTDSRIERNRSNVPSLTHVHTQSYCKVEECAP
jgi:hypothetical protein